MDSDSEGTGRSPARSSSYDVDNPVSIFTCVGLTIFM